MFLVPVTEAELINIIKNMKNKKSSGIDEIPDFIIKKCFTHITSPLCHIVNLSLSTGCFPNELKISKVKPLYKKGSENEVGNYRPVSLLSVFSKIIEKVMHKRLISYLNKYNIITDKQHGFQKGKSTNSAIINLIKNVYSSMDKKEISLGIFLDLSKAFDLVDHDILYKNCMCMEYVVWLSNGSSHI